jgi:hypothetical protein
MLYSPKFPRGGPSAKLQGAQKKLRVNKVEYIETFVFLGLQPLAGE